MSSKSKIPLFRVQDVNQNIRQILEDHFSSIGIRGELSSFVRHPSGHWYFTLKDDHSQIQGVMFRYANQKVPFVPKIGQEVIVWGKITVYEPRGSYQILANQMEDVGTGSLQKSFEELKEKLKKEGLFERKNPLPYLPQHIAVITSESGAALRDVLHVLHRRCKGIQVTIAPALMEGKYSALSVVTAFRQVLKLKDLDLILITRGGGSAESLWTFNDEKLAREVFKSPLPVVSAIGHEIDFTILDFVADLRAPTPSVAAELIAKNGEELLEKMDQQKKLLIDSWAKLFQFSKKQVLQYRKSLLSPLAKIEDYQFRCDDYMNRIVHNLKQNFELKNQNLQKLKAILHQLSPLSKIKDYQLKCSDSIQRVLIRLRQILELKSQNVKKLNMMLEQLNPKQIMRRGYSLCFQEQRLIQDASDIHTQHLLQIQFFKGKITAKVVKK